MLLDIALVPPEKLRKKLGEKAAKEIGGFPNAFVVDNVRRIPHLSLWHLRTSKSRVSKLTEELRQIVRKQKAIKITSTGFRILKKYKGDVEFTVEKNDALISLQEKVFKKIYSYKTGTMPPFFGRWVGEKRRQAERYGKPLGFKPHFTMGFLKNEEDARKVVKKMKKVSFSFFANEICLCEIDTWWQVKKIIKKIDFE